MATRSGLLRALSTTRRVKWPAAALVLGIEAEWRKRAEGVVPAQPKTRPEGQRHQTASVIAYDVASF